MSGLSGAVRAGVAVTAMMSSGAGPGIAILDAADGRLEAHIRACFPQPA